MGTYPSSLAVANGNSGKLKKEKRGKKKKTPKHKNLLDALGDL